MSRDVQLVGAITRAQLNMVQIALTRSAVHRQTVNRDGDAMKLLSYDNGAVLGHAWAKVSVLAL